MRRGSRGIQMGKRGGDMEKREKKTRDKSKFNYYQWRDLQKLIDCQFFCGLCEIKAPYKMDGALPLAFLSSSEIKNTSCPEQRWTDYFHVSFYARTWYCLSHTRRCLMGPSVQVSWPLTALAKGQAVWVSVLHIGLHVLLTWKIKDTSENIGTNRLSY